MDEEYARARLEASLGLHRAKIDTLRELELRLDARIMRLSELSQAAKALIESMMRNPFAQLDREMEVPVADEATLDAPEKKDTVSPKGSIKRSVSWVNEPLHEEVTLNSKDALQFPVHGHWVPHDVLERRASFQGEAALKLGGRHVELELTGEQVPCLLVEPMGKLINQEFVSTGMAIIFEERAFHDSKGLDEWAQVLKRTKLLDAGVSVAMPMLAPEMDVADLIAAIMRLCSTDLCLFLGKGAGARRALAAAASATGAAGSVLFAPKAPAPESCGFVGPAMLVWAQDDQDSPFDDAGSWAELLATREAGDAGAEPVAVLRDPTVGGHDLARMLRKDEACAQDILSFVATSLLLVELRRLDGTQMQQDRLLRLFEELPLQLTHQFCQLQRLPVGELEGKHADDLAAALVSHILQETKAAMEIAQCLSDWVNNDMRSVASASE